MTHRIKFSTKHYEAARGYTLLMLSTGEPIDFERDGSNGQYVSSIIISDDQFQYLIDNNVDFTEIDTGIHYPLPPPYPNERLKSLIP